jgi:K(+)-stimulated pyrophosphate-energized sodium pump
LLGWLAVASGVIGLIYAFLAALSTLKRDPGTGLIKEASDAVREGAEAFLKSEYKILAIFVIVVAIVLLVIGKISPSMSPWTAFAFVLGALCRYEHRGKGQCQNHGGSQGKP